MGPKKGDTPYPLQYIVSQESLSDNGGSFIARGTIKLMVKEQDLDLRHFEAIDDGDEISFTRTDNKQQIVHFINYVSRCRTTGHINGKYSTSAFRIDVDNVSLMLSPGSYILGRADMGLNEKLVGIGADTVHIDAYGAFFQVPLKTTGEYNHVIQIDISKNVTIKGLKAISGGDGLYIDSPITRDNNGYGILVILGTYINRSEKECGYHHRQPYFHQGWARWHEGRIGYVGTGHTYDWAHSCNGIVRYSGQVFLPGGPGLLYHSQNQAYAALYEVDIYIEDCGTKQNAANYFKSAVLVYGGIGTVNFPNGNLTLNAKIRDTRPTPLTFTDIYICNPNQEIENVTMYVDGDNRTTFGLPLVCNAAHNFKGKNRCK